MLVGQSEELGDVEPRVSTCSIAVVIIAIVAMLISKYFRKDVVKADKVDRWFVLENLDWACLLKQLFMPLDPVYERS